MNLPASDPALAPAVAFADCAAVIELLTGFLSTELGRAELRRLRFHRDPAECARLQRRNAEALAWLQSRGGFQFSLLEDDPSPLLAAAALPGAVLAASDLLRLAGFIDAVAALRGSLLDGAQGARSGQDGLNAAVPWPELAVVAGGLASCVELRRRLRAALLPSGELADDASPELASLRRRRVRQRQSIEDSLMQHLRRLGEGGALQDQLITVRNERFVLPVRSESRRRAPGVVHGASSSGQTVFVEPLDTVELNNDYIRLVEAEQVEVQRILAELTAAVAAEAPALSTSASAWGVLELESAKARFAVDYQAQPVDFAPPDRSVLELVDARHPVLVASLRARPDHPVVPLSLRLDADRLLVVSGPNTGGKTVVLKTVGMAAWMAQCGLPVCAARARLPVFDSIAADIGDVQSLEHNLSTFSSHLLHIRGILEAAGPAGLILLDELGAATNAAEGAALAVEIAAALLSRHAWTLISTHHDALKAWAATQPGVANGSVQVDPETLAPSYRFRLGVPGLSAGLDMAARLGLPAEVIDAARARLSEEQREAAGYLQRLQRQLAAADDRLREADARLAALGVREAAVAERERLIAEHDRAHQKRQLEHMRAELERRLTAFLSKAERTWRDTMEAAQGEITAAQKRKLNLASARLKRETTEAFQTEMQAGDGLPSEAPPPQAERSRAPQPGDQVRLRNLSRPAQILRRLGDNAFEISAGPLRMQVSRDDIVAVLGRPGSSSASTPAPDSASPAVLELNLIGLRAEEAVDQLEKFLDRAILAEAAQVRIVHGAGFGVLRKVVAETLRAHPQIAGFAHPPQNQGGQGVTIADLR